MAFNFPPKPVDTKKPGKAKPSSRLAAVMKGLNK